MRKYLDCRDQPSEKGCSLRISGTEEEVVDAAYDHAVRAHGEKPTDELREQLRAGLRDDELEAGGRVAGGVAQPGAVH